MITRPDIVERVQEWQLTEEVVEKDYVLGWLLWGIGNDPVLSDGALPRTPSTCEAGPLCKAQSVEGERDRCCEADMAQLWRVEFRG